MMTNHDDGVNKTKSPWKTTVSSPEFVDPPVMGGAQSSWPALAEAVQQSRPKNTQVQSLGNSDAKANHGHKNPSDRYSKPGPRSNHGRPPPYLMHSAPYYPPPVSVYPYAFYPPYPVLGAQGDLGNFWQHQRGFDPRNMPLNGGGSGPSSNFCRPPYMGRGPYVLAFEYDIPPPGAIRGPYHPHLANKASPVLSPEKFQLRERIVKQIEYYFGDVNLRKDPYLINLMDEEGWVPTKTIAGFYMIKAMTTDIEFIVYALGFSKLVEVKGEKMRRRDKWCDWVSTSKKSASLEKNGDSNKDSTSKPTTMCNFSSEAAESSNTNESDNLKSSVN